MSHTNPNSNTKNLPTLAGPIIVEGVDRAGKDTIIEAFRELITDRPTVMIHNTKPPRDLDPDSQHRVMKGLFDAQYTVSRYTRGHHLTIFNRGHISEAVYGSRYRGASVMSSLDPQDHLPPTAIIIHVTANPQDIFDRDDDKGAAVYYDVGVVEDLQARFSDVLRSTTNTIPYFTISNDGTPQQAARRMFRCIRDYTHNLERDVIA